MPQPLREPNVLIVAGILLYVSFAIIGLLMFMP